MQWPKTVSCSSPERKKQCGGQKKSAMRTGNHRSHDGDDVGKQRAHTRNGTSESAHTMAFPPQRPWDAVEFSITKTREIPHATSILRVDGVHCSSRPRLLEQLLVRLLQLTDLLCDARVKRGRHLRALQSEELSSKLGNIGGLHDVAVRGARRVRQASVVHAVWWARDHRERRGVGGRAGEGIGAACTTNHHDRLRRLVELADEPLQAARLLVRRADANLSRDLELGQLLLE